jgi:hypothetical protein
LDVSQFRGHALSAGVTLGVALQHAVRLKLIPHNVARDVKKPRHVPEEMQVLDPGQVQLFLESAKGDRLHAMYAFLIDSGARERAASKLDAIFRHRPAKATS